MSKNNKKKNSNIKWGIGLLAEIIIILLLVLGHAVVYINSAADKIVVTPLNVEELAINEGANEAQKGYTTIALFGIDSRDTENLGEGNRSDSIIIASINNDTKEVKMVSVYRDTFLQLQDGSSVCTKVNAAYAFGGPELAVKTLNASLDLQITDYVTVNFLALTKAIDHLGGVNVNVKNGELSSLNASIAEQISITGKYSDGVFNTGEQLLNGTQATAYARIRSTDQGDITRTQRQRDVILKMITKAKSSDFSNVDKIINDVFPNISTSIDKKSMLGLAKSLFDYETGPTTGFPFSFYPMNHETKGSVLVPSDLEYNVILLHEFLFETQDYIPTENVKRISTSIISETGINKIEIEGQIDTNLLQ